MSVQELLALAGDAGVQHAPFGARTTYRVGGTARVLVTVTNLEHLASLSPALRECELPVLVVGNGSNLLVADEEFNGVVLVLGEQFSDLSWAKSSEEIVVTLGAALALPVAARRLSDQGIVGFEWAVGVPGTVGGAAVMNAGGHGSDMAHCVLDLSAWSLASDELNEWTLADLDYGYRHSALRSTEVVTSVRLTLRRGSADEARSAVREIVRWRREHQPGGANAGSVFRNTPDAAAGSLIERAGLKGHRLGSAYVSEKHANFIQVDPGGRANDVVDLMIAVRAGVLERCGVTLQSELRTVGFEGRWP